MSEDLSPTSVSENGSRRRTILIVVASLLAVIAVLAALTLGSSSTETAVPCPQRGSDVPARAYVDGMSIESADRPGITVIDHNGDPVPGVEVVVESNEDADSMSNSPPPLLFDGLTGTDGHTDAPLDLSQVNPPGQTLQITVSVARCESDVFSAWYTSTSTDGAVSLTVRLPQAWH